MAISRGQSGGAAITSDEQTGLRRGLNGFDFTLLVVGAVIGADVYIVAGLAASYLGPAQLVAWLAGGVQAVASLIRLPDGRPAGVVEGEPKLPRAVIEGAATHDRLVERWPALHREDILASEGHIGRLAQIISSRSGQPEVVVPSEVEQILLEAI